MTQCVFVYAYKYNMHFKKNPLVISSIWYSKTVYKNVSVQMYTIEYHTDVIPKHLTIENTLKITASELL